MDYVAWVGRVKQFIAAFKGHHPGMKAEDRIGQPAKPEQVAEVETGIGRRLPSQFREFLLTASGECDFRYRWKGEADPGLGTTGIPGGLDMFANVSYLVRDYEISQEQAEEGMWGEEPFCRDPLPIASIGNGDEIAIDMRSEAVVFLSHDETSYVLGPDFDSFLVCWERICYLNFDLGFYERYIDKQGGGIITSNAEDMMKLRSVLLPSG